MKIVELILDEEQDTIGIDAISIVENPAIESDFVALKKQEIHLAELDKDKKILLGALLIPNKPIYRNGDEGEYYIYFSKETIVKASQLYLQNGFQNKSTLEHSKALEGLTLVESWIVVDEVNDKSRKYGLDVPVGTWMGAVKVNNDKVWNEYVKTNKVKGFSIEGYFADRMERPKEKIKEDMSEEKIASELLSKIENIVKGEKVSLSIVTDIQKQIADIKSARSEVSNATKTFEKAKSDALDVREKGVEVYQRALFISDNADNSAKELGVKADAIKGYKEMDDTMALLFKEYQDLLKSI